jgi:hypothetical protein
MAPQQAVQGQMAPQGPAAAVMPAMPAPTKYHDVTVVKKKTYAKARVMGVPPEEFGIERQARSIRDCGYCYHRVVRRQADLIAEGFDEDSIKELPTYVTQTGTEELARDTVNENTGTGGDKGLNTANRFLRVIEHYVRMDYEGDGKTKLYRVTTGGEVGSILSRNKKPDIVEVDDIPFAAMTPVPVTHRFFGRSLADLVMDIQRIKTALLRGLLDNTYLAVNQRPEVAESMANESTLDDLLVSRPGAPIRVKQAGCIVWQQMPSIADKILPTMEYLDSKKEERSGVSRQGQGPDPNALQNVAATTANLAYTAAQAKMKLIARIFAETGVRDMFSLLHETIRKHSSEAAVFRLRNQWVNVDPRSWKRRDDMTINVGLGSGGKTERLAHVMAVAGVQKDLLLGGKTNLVSDQNLYSTAKEIVKASDLKNVDSFFTDPKDQPPPQAPPSPEMIKAQVEAQKAQGQMALAKAKQDADTQHQVAKMQADAALEQQKFEHEKQLAMMQHGMAVEAHRMNMTAKAVDIASKPRPMGPDGQPMAPSVDIEKLLGQLAQLHAPTPHAAPKGFRVVRDQHNRISHTEPVT